MMEPGRPFLPRARDLYWVDGAILPFDDVEDQRAVVVLDVPATTSGTVGVALRSGGGRVPVQGVLWTAANVARVP